MFQTKGNFRGIVEKKIEIWVFNDKYTNFPLFRIPQNPKIYHVISAF
jgi:hypothetical protein